MIMINDNGDHAKVGDFVQYCKGNGDLIDDFGLVIAVKSRSGICRPDGQSLKMLQVYSATVPQSQADWVNAEFFRIRSKA
jgi:hypothetical protein